MHRGIDFPPFSWMLQFTQSEVVADFKISFQLNVADLFYLNETVMAAKAKL